MDGAARGQSIALTPDGQDGNTSACWEKTAIAITNTDSASDRCPQFLETQDTDSAVVDSNERITSVGENNNGTTSGTPELILVKRITAINSSPSDEVRFTDFVNDDANNDGNFDNDPDNDDNWPNPPNTYLRGAVNIDPDEAVVKPGDEVEYTIYFLSNGEQAATNVKICDLVPQNMAFVSDSYNGAGYGIALKNNTDLSTPSQNLSNAKDADEGTFYAPSIVPLAADGSPLCRKPDPSDPDTFISIDAEDNINGAVVIEIDNIPAAKDDSVNSYGLIRFRAEVE